MTDVGIMIEEQAAKEWEKLNAPTDSAMLHLAAKSLGYAIDELDTSCDSVQKAMESLLDTPEGDRVASALSELESVLKELKELQSKWEVA